MPSPLLHLPLDFEMREDVRRLVQILRPALGEGARQIAAIYFVRLWCDWGRCGAKWRPLDQPFQGVQHDWSKEPIANIISEFCEPRSTPPEFMKLILDAGVVKAVQEGDMYGLVLNDYWSCNDHLSPDFKSTQQRGGHAKAEKRRQAAAEEMAGQQRALLERQGSLTFPEDLKVSPEEQKKAIALLIRMDRACGQPVRSSSQYSAPLLQQALAIVRAYKNEHITLVERYLAKNHDNPEVVKIPDRVIANFDQVFKAVE